MKPRIAVPDVLVCVHRQDLHTILRDNCSVNTAQSLLSLHNSRVQGAVYQSFVLWCLASTLAEIVYLCIDSSDSISGSLTLSLSSSHTLEMMDVAKSSTWSLLNG
jgi:hypothetical protein